MPARGGRPSGEFSAIEKGFFDTGIEMEAAIEASVPEPGQEAARIRTARVRTLGGISYRQLLVAVVVGGAMLTAGALFAMKGRSPGEAAPAVAAAVAAAPAAAVAAPALAVPASAALAAAPAARPADVTAGPRAGRVHKSAPVHKVAVVQRSTLTQKSVVTHKTVTTTKAASAPKGTVRPKGRR
jgi:hypothetical protein